MIHLGQCHKKQTGDPWWSKVTLLLDMEGSDSGTTFTDASASPKTVTAYGDAHTESDQKKYGSTSCALDGTGDYLTIDSTSGLQFGTGDFTVEAWVYLTATQGAEKGHVIGRTEYGTNADWMLQIGGDSKVYFYLNNAFIATSTATVAATTWTHIAAGRKGTAVYIAVDGVLSTGTSALSTENSASGVYTIGADQGGNEAVFTGYIDDLRVTKGVWRYGTTTFDPPSAAFPTS